jgi:hypothetical protein
MSRGSVRLLTEAGDLHPHAFQEAGKLGGSFELGYRIELLNADVKAFVRLHNVRASNSG